MKRLRIEQANEWIGSLTAGEEVLLSGEVYTARDAVHKRWKAALEAGEALPISFENTGIYYAGPTGAPEGMPIGSCGPTTSSRMDPYYPALARMGLRITIGKGDRSSAVYEAIKETEGVYFCAIGGAGALYATRIESCQVVGYSELGCESLKKLVLKDFPVFVGIDSRGNSLFGGT